MTSPRGARPAAGGGPAALRPCAPPLARVAWLAVQYRLVSAKKQPLTGRATRGDDVAEVVNLLRRLFRGVHQYSKAMLRRTGFSAPQVWAVNLIGADPGLSLRALSERMFAHPSTVSGVVDRLVERGVVDRAVDPRDRRGVRLTLTTAGRRELRRCPPPIQDALRRAVAGLPPARRRVMREALEYVARATETDRVKAPFFDLD